MYCRKCGTAVRTGDVFCPQCGARTMGESPTLKKGLTSIYERLLNDPRVARLGDAKGVFFAGLFLMMVCALISGKEMLTFSYDVRFYDDVVYVALLEGYKFPRLLFRIAYFASIAWAVYPVVKNINIERWHLLPAAAVALVGVALLGITVLSGFETVTSYFPGGEYNGVYYHGSALWDWVDVSIGMTWEGYVFLLSSVAALLLMYKASKATPEAQKNYLQKQAEEKLFLKAENGTNNHVRCPYCGRIQKSVSSFCEECYEPLT